MNHPRPRAVGEWLLLPAPQHHPAPRLFCFPHAGGDATAFVPMGRALAPAAEVWAVRMPARGGRTAVPMPATFRALVRTLAAALLPHLGAGPVAFYGQSFGALLALETARALRPEHRPTALILAAAEPPGAWPGAAPPEYDAERLLDVCGAGALVAEVPELRERALAAIRADLAVRSGYRYRPGPPLACGLYALSGAADPLVRAHTLAGWSAHTTGRFAHHTVPGGHLPASVDDRGPVGLLTSILERTRESSWSPPQPAPNPPPGPRTPRPAPTAPRSG
ncbi:alpha/beta fold hydrolase [Streptomyces sp. TRM 70351]|uniref:thioesterase II family protein n=1 Tax=Streptomyces sp. TRM 70351 TaxID=3116552 RepID=UPI002E7B4221|nr:alpha/beta fold hydrolase [Streptomyces sp. TRM 70351]MEE1929014.1 alpha/beta fold hydrolase [Streptomyces sp. TRM 70351]